MAHGGRARGGDGGGGTREQFPLLGSLKNLTMGWGEAWGGGPWRAGKGGDGGGREQCGFFLGSPYQLVDLAGDEAEKMGGGVGRWPMEGGQGGRWGGGHQRAVWEQQKVHWFLVLGSLKRVGGWGEAWGGGPWRVGKGGELV